MGLNHDAYLDPAVVAPRPDSPAPPMIDLAVDGHVHTGFSVGRDSVGAIVTAAERLRLSRITFGDIATPRSSWLTVYQRSILRAQQRTEVQLGIAVEVEAAREDGWLDLPVDLAGLHALSVAVSRLPVAGAPADLYRVRELLDKGTVREADVVEIAIHTTALAVERASRYAPTRLARPLSLLWQLGVDESQIDDTTLSCLVDVCRVTNTVVEVSECWRTPSARLARLFLDGGVTLVAASDARDLAQVGQWRYVSRVLSRLATRDVPVSAG